ncbi:MAG: ATP-binding cassette domain-containing protein [Desulfurococcales archaeon]|nr:ATP-binding cassette domain-containing protein [Desulfurococcales archaeon]
MARPYIEVRDVWVVYPNGVEANRGVSVEVNRGEVLAILGENGAGKTTLLKVMAGLVRPTRGSLVVDGKLARFKSHRDALAMGIAMVPQNPVVFGNLTVLEDVGLTLSLAGRGMPRGRLRIYLERISGDYNLELSLDSKIWSLSMGEKQRVEILKALSIDARVILLDEPSTHLTPGEVENLIKLTRRLASEDKGIVYVTHRIQEALAASDKIMVMRDGRVVGVVDRRRASKDTLLRMMFGEKITGKPVARSKQGFQADRPVLEVEDLWVKGDHGEWSVRGVTLRLREGEIVGIAGVAGNGQRELIEAIIGLRRHNRGIIKIAGVDASRLEPPERARLGLSFIPEERLGWSLVPGKNLLFNTALSILNSNGLRMLIDWRQLESKSMDAIRLLGVKTEGLYAPVDSLSGGNMQRFIIARELLKNPRLLVAMNPIAGLDYKASILVEEVFLEARNKGTGVLVVSEELDFLLDIADRILVMSKGRITLSQERPFDVKAIARAMTT